MLLRIRSKTTREFLAEFAGTFILMVFGDASVAQSVLSKGASGDFFSINWGFGIAVMLGIFVSGGVTGGHLNPAVTLAMAIGKQLHWKKVPIYFLAQYLGAFVAAAVVYGLYYDALINIFGDERLITGVNGTVNGTAGIFATYPTVGISTATGLFDQIVGTALLLFCVRAITDEKNMNVPTHLRPLSIGFVVLNIGICFGYNCGYAINPARDFAPRLFSFFAGYGTEVFSAFDYWMFMPILGPHLGAIIGSLLYDLFVGFHWPLDDQEAGIEASEAADLPFVIPISLTTKDHSQ